MIVVLLWPPDILTPVNDSEDIHPGRLSEIQYAVRILEDFPHILILRLRGTQADIGELGEAIYSTQNALDHAVGVEGRGVADV